MNKRYIAAGTMLAAAFTLWLVATARADEIGSYQLSEWALIVAGLLLAIGAFPVSGDLNDEYEESGEIEMKDEYCVTLDVTEQGLDGSYVGQPHTYKKCCASAEEAQRSFDDLLWECIEIEDIGNGRIFAEWSVEKNGEYFDHDEFELEIVVEHTDKPSRYFVDNGNPIPMSVDRARSNLILIG